MKFILDKTLIPILRYVRRKTSVEKSTRVLDEVSRRIASSSADYVEAKMTRAIIFEKRELLWDYVFSLSLPSGNILEFGVAEGGSINHFSTLTDQPIFGFDSFEGLREDWDGTHYLKGHFSRDGVLPKVATSVSLIKGWFDETLPVFLEDNKEPVKIVHVDGDTYQAAVSILEILRPRFLLGTVIIFDEYFGYLGWKEGEYKAWQELVTKYDITYRYLGFSENSVAVQII